MTEYLSSRENNDSFDNIESANIKLERDEDPDSAFVNSEDTYCINNDENELTYKIKFPSYTPADTCFVAIKTEERELDEQTEGENLPNREFPVQEQSNYENSECNSSKKCQNPASQAPDSSNSDNNDNIIGKRWPPVMIKLLLETLLKNKDTLRNPRMKARTFEKISKLMLEHSFTFSPAEVRKKYNNLRISYRKIKDACMSKDARKDAVVTWEYFGIMDELYWEATPDPANNLMKESLLSDSKLVCSDYSINSAILHTIPVTKLYNESISSVPVVCEPVVESIIQTEVCPSEDLSSGIGEKKRLLLEEQENSSKKKRITNETNTHNKMFVEGETFNVDVKDTLSSIDVNMGVMNANMVAINTNLAAMNANISAMNTNMDAANATLMDLSKAIKNVASGILAKLAE